MMGRAVVIGGAGFIGSYVVRELLSQNFNVVVIDNLSVGKKENIPTNIPLIVADITNKNELMMHIKEGDIIFHLAALTSVPESIEYPEKYNAVNVEGARNVFEIARIKKVRGIIFSSSASVYGNQEGVMHETNPTKPESPYAQSKVEGENLGKKYAEEYKLPSVSLRYFNVYGKGNNETGSYAPVTARFLKQKREGSLLTITGDGSQTRDFIHVEDVARANVFAIKLLDNKESEILNISSGKATSVKEIANIIGGEIEYLPERKEIKHSLGDNTKAKELLGWEPSISIEEGIKELLNEK